MCVCVCVSEKRVWWGRTHLWTQRGVFCSRTCCARSLRSQRLSRTATWRRSRLRTGGGEWDGGKGGGRRGADGEGAGFRAVARVRGLGCGVTPAGRAGPPVPRRVRVCVWGRVRAKTKQHTHYGAMTRDGAQLEETLGKETMAQS